MRTTFECSSPAATTPSQNHASGERQSRLTANATIASLSYAALRLQEIPIGTFLVVRHSDHDALYARKFLVIRRPNLHTAITTKQPAIIHDRVYVRAPAALKRADGPRGDRCYEIEA